MRIVRALFQCCACCVAFTICAIAQDEVIGEGKSTLPQPPTVKSDTAAGPSRQSKNAQPAGYDYWDAKPARGVRQSPLSLDIIKAKRDQTIAGASLLFVGMALDYGVMLPWSMRFSAHIKAHHDSVTSDDAGESISILLASVPIGMAQIGGATIACAGASRVYGAYAENIDPNVTDVKVWIPYIIGWVARGAGGALGLIGSLAKSPELSTTATFLSIGSQAAWTASTVMSLVYSNRWYWQARRKIAMTPFYVPGKGSGLAMSGEF